MRVLYFIILLLFSSTLLTSQSWALPDCPSSPPFHNCFGTFTWASGSKYIGEWKDNKRNGQGTFTFPSGDVKEGVWKDGEFQYAKKIAPKPQTNTCFL